MWDDVIIGKGNRGNTAIRVDLSESHSISENSTSFWIGSDDLLLDVDMIIFKDTNEGKKLQLMIENKDVDYKWLNLIMLKNLKVEILRAKIKELRDESFENGKRYKEQEFKRCLGIR